MLVIGLAGVQAWMQASEDFVEQVSLDLVFLVSSGAASVEVAAGAQGDTQRGERADRPASSRATVSDIAVQNNGFLTAGPGEWYRSGECCECAGVGEPAAVITDLGEYSGAGEHSRPGKAGDDLGVRVLLKMGDRRLRLHRQQRGKFSDGVADPATSHDLTVIVDRHDVVMSCMPIDSATQPQRVLIPSIRDHAVADGLTRRPKRGITRSTICDCSAQQDFVLSNSSSHDNSPENRPCCGLGRASQHLHTGSTARRAVLSEVVSRQERPVIT